ncbi:MAG: hypothetical protein P8X63_03705 [Desulfuromonadaceae bacterium]
MKKLWFLAMACHMFFAVSPVLGNQPTTLYANQRIVASEPGKFKYEQQHFYWSAIALRSAAPRNWDMALYTDDSYVDRVAFSDLGAGLVDIIAVDYNHAPTGVEGVKVLLAEGSWNYSIEFDVSIKHLDTYAENGPFFYWPTQLIEVWEVWLSSGESFLFKLDNLDELSDPGIALFDSDQSHYYRERKAAVAIADEQGEGKDESFIYTASHDGWYGFVVWFNTNGFNEFKINITKNQFRIKPRYFNYVERLKPVVPQPIKKP